MAFLLSLLTLEMPVRISAVLLVNRDPIDFGGEVTHFYMLPTSQSFPSTLAVVTLYTDEFGERKSTLALWDIRKSTPALHAAFSQLSYVSNVPLPKDEAVYPRNAALMIVFNLVETEMRIAWGGHIYGHPYFCQLDHSRLHGWIRGGSETVVLQSYALISRLSVDKAEEPLDNSKNVMTVFDGGFSFPKPENGDESTFIDLLPLTDEGFLATIFSPNLVAYASLHASGRVTIHPMQSDPSSPLLPVVFAQRFTNALKKGIAPDDIYLVAERYLNEGSPLPTSHLI